MDYNLLEKYITSLKIDKFTLKCWYTWLCLFSFVFLEVKVSLLIY